MTPFSHYILTMNKNVPCKLFVSRLFVKRILLVFAHVTIFKAAVYDLQKGMVANFPLIHMSSLLFIGPSTFFETTTWIQQLKNHTFTACIATYIMFGHQGILLRLSNNLALSGFIQTHFLCLC